MRPPTALVPHRYPTATTKRLQSRHHKPPRSFQNQINPPFSSLHSSTQLQLTPARLISHSATPAHQLCAAFILGGFFFSRVVPPFLAFAALAYRRIFIQSRLRWNDKRAKLFSRQKKEKEKRANQENTPVIAVGKEGLVAVQYVAEKLVGRSFQTQLRRALEKVVEEVDNPNIGSMKVESFSTQPDNQNSQLTLQRGRIHNMTLAEQNGDETCMVFDIDVDWKNCIDLKLQIVTKRLELLVPVHVHNCYFHGTIRIVLTPLMDEPPGFGAVLVSVPTIPTIEMDIDVAGGQITKVPWLKEELLDAVEGLVRDQLLWPSRVVNPLFLPNTNATQLSKKELAVLESTDPFLKATKTSEASQPRNYDRKKTSQSLAKVDSNDRQDARKRPLKLWNRFVSGVLRLGVKTIKESDIWSEKNGDIKSNVKNTISHPQEEGKLSRFVDNLAKSLIREEQESDPMSAYNITDAIDKLSGVQSMDEFFALFGEDAEEQQQQQKQPTPQG